MASAACSSLVTRHSSLFGGRPRWVIAGSLGLTAALAACALRIGYDHNLLHLQAEGLDSVQWELKLIEHTAGASWHALSYTATPRPGPSAVLLGPFQSTSHVRASRIA